MLLTTIGHSQKKKKIARNRKVAKNNLEKPEKFTKAERLLPASTSHGKCKEKKMHRVLLPSSMQSWKTSFARQTSHLVVSA